MQLLPLARLLRLASPALPVGAYGYSQGLETAMTRGWIAGEEGIGRWIGDVLELSLARFEGPMFCRLHAAWSAGDSRRAEVLNALLLAGRESAEFRAETCQMGHSLRTLLESTAEFPVDAIRSLQAMPAPAFPTVFAFAAAHWGIEVPGALCGYLFAWAENQVGAAIKAAQIGHVAGQRLLGRLSSSLPAWVDAAVQLDDNSLSNFAPALAIAGCLHETQDGRMFRS